MKVWSRFLDQTFDLLLDCEAVICHGWAAARGFPAKLERTITAAAAGGGYRAASSAGQSWRPLERR